MCLSHIKNGNGAVMDLKRIHQYSWNRAEHRSSRKILKNKKTSQTCFSRQIKLSLNFILNRPSTIEHSICQSLISRLVFHEPRFCHSDNFQCMTRSTRKIKGDKQGDDNAQSQHPHTAPDALGWRPGVGHANQTPLVFVGLFCLYC